MNKQNISELIRNYHLDGTASKIHKYLSLIYRTETNSLMKSYIKEVIYLNKNYKYFIETNYISLSSFFRLRNQLIDKIYHLLILDNKVTRDEILND